MGATTLDCCDVLARDRALVLSHTGKLWEALQGKAVFITGGTGFFGRWLLESFAEANRRLELGARVVSLSRHPELFESQAPNLAADPSIQLVRGSIRNLDAADVSRQLGPLAPERFAFVIHAAADTSLTANRDHPLEMLDSTWQGTLRALDFAVQSQAEGFLLTSSGAVYGGQPPDLSHVAETYPGAPDPAAPLSAYGEAKRVAEMQCAIYHQSHGLNCKIARGFAFVGPYLKLDAHYAIGNFIRNALSGEAIQVNGDGSPFRSYLYGADLAIWLWTLLLHPAAHGTYNVGSDEAYSIREVAECVSRQAPRRATVTLARQPNPQTPAQRYIPDIRRARRELGLEVWTKLDVAIQNTIKFHQQTDNPII